MPGNRCVVGEHAVVADDGVMSDVRIRHEYTVVAYARGSATLGRAAMERDPLANRVVVADVQPGRLATKLGVWSSPDFLDRLVTHQLS
jgi:hypothetical protein